MMQDILNKTSCTRRSPAARIVPALVIIAVLSLAGSASADPLPDFNNICIRVANDAGVKYDSYGNDTYSVRFEGYDRGLNALHISTDSDPVMNFGQVTVTNALSGTFYATDSGGKGYEDDILLMIAVNGTVPPDFSVRITSDGYNWTPNPISNQAPPKDTVNYQPVGLDETFTADDFVYGPQIWKPTGNGFDYPIFAGQDMSDTGNTFRMMFVDLNSGVLRPDELLQNHGAVRINYSFGNLRSFAAFGVYAYCNNSNNGETMVAWGNGVYPTKAMSGYSVIGILTPDTEFDAEPRNGTAPLAVNFTDTSPGEGITGYQWVFSDEPGTVHIDRNLTHVFSGPGIYSVNHSATNSFGTSWTNRTGYITVTAIPPPDVAAIAPAKHKQNGRTFTATVTGTGFQPGVPVTNVSLNLGTKTIRATNVGATSESLITCSIKIPKNAKTGLYTVLVTNPDGQSDSLAKKFRVV